MAVLEQFTSYMSITNSSSYEGRFVLSGIAYLNALRNPTPSNDRYLRPNIALTLYPEELDQHVRIGVGDVHVDYDVGDLGGVLYDGVAAVGVDLCFHTGLS